MLDQSLPILSNKEINDGIIETLERILKAAEAEHANQQKQQNQEKE